jgi:hypothetical protein
MVNSFVGKTPMARGKDKTYENLRGRAWLKTSMVRTDNRKKVRLPGKLAPALGFAPLDLGSAKPKVFILNNLERCS